MKKLLSVLVLALIVSFGLVACGGETTAPATGTTTEEELTYEIALVTDVGNIDDKSFNEGAWNGVMQYAEENSVSYAYYRPTEDSETARISAIESAIAKGAKIVVCPGFLFETAIYAVQDDHSDVAFLLLDGTPNNGDWGAEGGPTWRTADNVHNVLYQEEQSGFLAGYAAVKEGYRELGFAGGMAVPAVVRFGYGYVQGAEYAAQELGLSAGDVTIEYYYANAFAPSPDLETKMDLWYAGGMEVVFACGGKLYQSVVNAAEATQNGKVIGVDVDQHFESDRIITSAMKGLTVSVYDALTAFYDNDKVWPAAYAGQTAVLGADTDGIGLPTDAAAWGFDNFTVAEYDSIFAELVAGTLVVSNAIDAEPTVSLVTVTYSSKPAEE